jgi:hypothetical protein
MYKLSILAPMWGSGWCGGITYIMVSEYGWSYLTVALLGLTITTAITSTIQQMRL